MIAVREYVGVEHLLGRSSPIRRSSKVWSVLIGQRRANENYSFEQVLYNSYKWALRVNDRYHR